ncbi:DUF3667 domain-containing protein [Altererythrobacter sp. GH1-8]|uniref:DUF3667 domain-containing protein n=1 Tax=Altererythrobacter sp. GH1-8 TaxID=3349333 RepID=UPI00374CB908
MGDFTDGLGTAAEGGLLARAVEPRAGETAQDGETSAKTCLNCGTQLTGAYCHQCGQKAETHRSLSAIGHEIMHGVLHLDGKIWRTLPLLLFKPGQLTRRYIEGERAKFVGPMAMFLFSVFLMFAVFQMFGLTTPVTSEADPPAAVSELATEEAERVAAQLAEVEAQLASPTLTDEERASLSRQKANLDAELKLLAGEIPMSEWLKTSGDARLPASDADAESETAQSVDVARSRFDDVAASDIPVISKVVQKWQENPELMLYKLQANAYKFSWLLIPLSIPFVWLIFSWKRRFKAYDHAIFVTYSLAFMSLLFVLLSVLEKIGFPEGLVTLATLIIPPLHIYKQLRATYDLSRFSALWRLSLLMIGILAVLIIFVQVLLLLGTG